VRTIIAGSRDIVDYEFVVAHIERAPFSITTVLCGMCRGVDMIGYVWAKSKGIPVEEHEALWDLHGPAAGPRRNESEARQSEALVLVWNGTSSGSADMLRRAHKYGLKIHELRLP
jgi:hypothetical protein